MSTIYFNVVGRIFAAGVTLNESNVITHVDTTQPSLERVETGMVVRSIGGVPVGNGRLEQARLAEATAEVLVALAVTAKDEFHLSSDDEGNEAFQPPTALPSSSPEFNNSVAIKSSKVVLEATEKCAPGGCVIIMFEGANPALPVALAAKHANAEVMYIDTVARLKTRQTADTAGDFMRRSLEKGLWIFIEQATKSITLLRELADCITEIRAAGRVHEKARVLLMCEPHPHFPEALISGSITLRSRLQSDDVASVEMQEEFLASSRRREVIHGDVVNANTEAKKPEVALTKKKVRISNQVNIVHLEKSAFLEMSASAKPGVDAVPSADGITRVAKYTFGNSEKLISLCNVSDHRFAIGTNNGYVVLIDRDGLPLIQFRPHKECIWDLSFSSQFDFSTACEDGLSIICNYSLSNQELTTVCIASFQNDVFAVQYANPSDTNSAVLSGGLSATICVLHSDRQNNSFIACRTSIQAITTTQSKLAMIGGGNGTCSLVDIPTCQIIGMSTAHNKKVPAVSSYETQAITGGFDNALRIWDVRNGFHLTWHQELREVVTAVSMNDQYVTACSGSSLFVWDQRKMDRTLAEKPNAWKDLTRGLVLDGKTVVTASVDGVARIWEIH